MENTMYRVNPEDTGSKIWLGPPARCPSLPTCLGCWVPLKPTTEKVRYPYSKLSTGGLRQAESGNTGSNIWAPIACAKGQCVQHPKGAHWVRTLTGEMGQRAERLCRAHRVKSSAPRKTLDILGSGLVICPGSSRI